MIKHVNNLEQFKDAIKEGKVLVDFYATWCGPCRMLAPVLEEIDANHEIEGLTIIKIDVDEVPTVAGMFNVQSIPTLILFKDGKMINHSLGFMPKPALINFLNNNF